MLSQLSSMLQMMLQLILLPILLMVFYMLAQIMPQLQQTMQQAVEQVERRVRASEPIVAENEWATIRFRVAVNDQYVDDRVARVECSYPEHVDACYRVEVAPGQRVTVEFLSAQPKVGGRNHSYLITLVGREGWNYFNYWEPSRLPHALRFTMPSRGWALVALQYTYVGDDGASHSILVYVEFRRAGGG